MAGTVSLLRTSLPRLLGATVASTQAIASPAVVSSQQKRSIVHKSLLQLDPYHPKPWPYREKGYNHWHALFDRTKPRLHKNSKLIVVEGNIGCDYSTTAKELANELGFAYMPEFKMDHILIDRYGIDLRDYYHHFPKCFRIPDMEMFYKNPMDDMTAAMIDRMYICKYEQFLNACAHILNTAQGVVLERSPYTDFVLTNAMRAKNYIGLEYFKHYYYVRKTSLLNLHFWPHLVVYLDAPVNVCLENIRKEGNVNKTATIDETFLKTVEESYKDSLKELKTHSRLLIYDWTKPGHTDSIVEDIEKLDFDFFEWHSGDVMEEWFSPNDEVSMTGWRIYVTEKRNARNLAFHGIQKHEVGELYVNPRDMGHFINVMKKEVLKSLHGYGYIRERGDPVQGLSILRIGQNLPEPWYEYYYREAYYFECNQLESGLDPLASYYDPDYLHH